MKRQEVILESSRFTKLSEFSRELQHLLEYSDYKIEAHIKASEKEYMNSALESWKTLGRLKVKIDADGQRASDLES